MKNLRPEVPREQVGRSEGMEQVDVNNQGTGHTNLQFLDSSWKVQAQRVVTQPRHTASEWRRCWGRAGGGGQSWPLRLGGGERGQGGFQWAALGLGQVPGLLQGPPALQWQRETGHGP